MRNIFYSFAGHCLGKLAFKSGDADIACLSDFLAYTGQRTRPGFSFQDPRLLQDVIQVEADEGLLERST